MRIGIDIDDTITNTQAKIDEIAALENIDIFDRTKHWFYERYNCTMEEDEAFLTKHIENIMSNATLKEDVTYIINKLYDEGNDIYFITARSSHYSKNIPDITVEYLSSHGIKYTDIIFGCKNKAEVCKNYGIDIFIDDSVEHIKDVTELGIKTIVIDNEYNKEIGEVRASTWLDVYEIIKGGAYGRKISNR